MYWLTASLLSAGRYFLKKFKFGSVLQSTLLLVFIQVYEFPVAAQTISEEQQKSEKLPGLIGVGVGLQHGFIFPHSKDVQNTKGARPTGLELTVSWQKNDPQTWDLCRCFPRQGVSLAYYNYDNAILGKSGNLAYFLEPTYRISNTVFLSFKGSAGLAYLTNPYDSIQNPTNQSYSTTISAYLLFGGGVWFRLNERWWLQASANYQHISNGGMKKPNKGINWPTAGISVTYQPYSRPYQKGLRSTEKYWRQEAPRWDLGVLGTATRGATESGSRTRYAVAGLFLQGAKQVGRTSALNLGTEVYYHAELQQELRKTNPRAPAVKAGVMLGHEFILGKFLFNQRLGYYLLNPEANSDQLFHRWGLHYRINPQFGAGFNLLAHRQVAEFIDLRLTYSFQKKR